MKKYTVLIFVIFIVNSLYGQKFDWAFGAGGWTDDFAAGIATDSNNNVYLTGHSDSGAKIGNATINWGAYLVKFTNSGSIEWTVNFGNFDTYGVGVAVDSNGNVFLAGIYSYGFSYGGIYLAGGLQPRIFLMKFDKDGKLLWSKDFGTISDTGSSFVNSIALDKDNNIYLGGNFQDPIKLGDKEYNVKGRSTFDSDMLLIKLSANGEILWVNTPGSLSTEYIYDIAVNSDGVYVVGYMGGNTIDFDSVQFSIPKDALGCVFKYSLSGKLEWFRSIDSPMNSISFSVTLNDAGEVIVAGSWIEDYTGTGEYISVTKFDRNGKLLNNQLINNSQYLEDYNYAYFSIKRCGLTTYNNCVYLTTGLSGSTKIGNLSLGMQGAKNIALVKFNEVGFPQWISGVQGSDFDTGLRLSSQGNNIYMTGEYSSNNLKFGNQSITNNSGNADNDFFLTKVIDTTSIILCPNIDSFKVSYEPIICAGDSTPLLIKNSYATYTKWFLNENQLNHDNDKQIYIKGEGTYSVKINQNTRCPVPEIKVFVDSLKNLKVTTNITINPLPTVDIIGKEQICQDDTLSLYTFQNDNYSYKWTVPKNITNFSSTENLLKAKINVTGSERFYVNVQNKVTGCINVDSFTTVINPKPELHIYKTVDSLYLYSNFTDSVKWFHKGYALSEWNNQQFIYLKEIGYYYVIGTNKFGCVSISDSVNVKKISYIEPELTISPNPVTNNVYISQTSIPEKVELFKITGNLIKTFKNESILNMENLDNGIYIIKVYTKDRVKIFKIIKD